MKIYKRLSKVKYENGDYSLVPLREKDIYKIKKWRNAQINCLRQKELLTNKAQKKYFNEVVKPSFLEKEPEQMLFSYLYKNKCIGYGGLVHISWPKKSAELSFLLSLEYMNMNRLYKRYFEEFIHLLLNIAFKDLKFDSIFTETYSFRTLNIKVLEKNGFKYEGIMKNRKSVDGKLVGSLVHRIFNNKSVIKKQCSNKKLFVIFGTSHGLGKALYEYAFEYKTNDFFVVNRNETKYVERTKELIVDLSKQLKAKDIDGIMKISSSKKYNEVYFIYNASTINPLKPIGIAKPEEYIGAFYVNVINDVILVDNIIKKIASSSNKKIRILNITSGAATSPHYGLATYCSTKSALEMFTQCIYLEQKNVNGIQIAAFRPGIVDTNIQKQMRSSSLENFSEAKLYNDFYKKGKLLDPEMVAKKIYQNIITDQFWTKSVTNIKELE